MATTFSGGTYISQAFAGTTRWSIMQNILNNLVKNVTNAGWTNIALSAGQGPGNQQTATITAATPAVATSNGHGFLGGEKIIFATTGALPTGLSVNTVYFVKFIDANTFNVAATLGGANINTTGSASSGTTTVYTQTVIMESATQTNVTNPIRVKIQDNLGNCVTVSILNQAGTVVGSNDTTHGGMLLPNASTNFQILATKYWFACFLLSATGSRKFVMAGMVFVPSAVAISDHGFMLSDADNDTTSTAKGSFRNSMNIAGISTDGNPNSQVIWGANLLEHANGPNDNTTGLPQAIIAMTASVNNTATTSTLGWYRWKNDQLNDSDVLLVAGLTSISDEAKIIGPFFDLVYLGGGFTMDATDTFNGHNWWNLTNNNNNHSAHNAPIGGAWVATS